MDLYAQMVSPDSTSVFYVDSLQCWVEKTMAIDGRVYSEVQYADSLLTIRQGTEVYYYSAGRIKSVAHYQNGKLNGMVNSYYSDGRVRRKDMYEDDRLVEGSCFGANGMPLQHTDYKKDVYFPGGIAALYSIISANSQQIELQNESVSGIVRVKIFVDKKGNVTNKVIVQNLHPLFDAEVLRICEHLGKFEPAEREGETVPGSYIISIKF